MREESRGREEVRGHATTCSRFPNTVRQDECLHRAITNCWASCCLVTGTLPHGSGICMAAISRGEPTTRSASQCDGNIWVIMWTGRKA